MIRAFFRWAATHYRTPAGEPTTEIGELKWSLRPVRELYGHTPAREFGPRSLATVRQHMIELGWCRSLINRRIDRVKRAFKWAASEELVPVTTLPGPPDTRRIAKRADRGPRVESCQTSRPGTRKGNASVSHATSPSDGRATETHRDAAGRSVPTPSRRGRPVGRRLDVSAGASTKPLTTGRREPFRSAHGLRR